MPLIIIPQRRYKVNIFLRAFLPQLIDTHFYKLLKPAVRQSLI